MWVGTHWKVPFLAVATVALADVRAEQATMPDDRARPGSRGGVVAGGSTRGGSGSGGLGAGEGGGGGEGDGGGGGGGGAGGEGVEGGGEEVSSRAGGEGSADEGDGGKGGGRAGEGDGRGGERAGGERAGEGGGARGGERAGDGERSVVTELTCSVGRWGKGGTIGAPEFRRWTAYGLLRAWHACAQRCEHYDTWQSGGGRPRVRYR